MTYTAQDERLAQQIAAVHMDMDSLAQRIDALMLDFADRRRERAESALGAGEPEVVTQDRDYGRALDLRARWGRQRRSLDNLFAAWTKQLPGQHGKGQQL